MMRRILAVLALAVGVLVPAAPALAHATTYVTSMDRSCTFNAARTAVTCTRFGQRVTYRAEPSHILRLHDGTVVQSHVPRSSPPPNTTS